MKKKYRAHDFDLFARCKRCGKTQIEVEDGGVIMAECDSDAALEARQKKAEEGARVNHALKRIRKWPQ